MSKRNTFTRWVCVFLSAIFLWVDIGYSLAPPKNLSERGYSKALLRQTFPAISEEGPVVQNFPFQMRSSANSGLSFLFALALSMAFRDSQFWAKSNVFDNDERPEFQEIEKLELRDATEEDPLVYPSEKGIVFNNKISEEIQKIIGFDQELEMGWKLIIQFFTLEAMLDMGSIVSQSSKQNAVLLKAKTLIYLRDFYQSQDAHNKGRIEAVLKKIPKKYPFRGQFTDLLAFVKKETLTIRELFLFIRGKYLFLDGDSHEPINQKDISMIQPQLTEFLRRLFEEKMEEVTRRHRVPEWEYRLEVDRQSPLVQEGRAYLPLSLAFSSKSNIAGYLQHISLRQVYLDRINAFTDWPSFLDEPSKDKIKKVALNFVLFRNAIEYARETDIEKLIYIVSELEPDLKQLYPILDTLNTNSLRIFTVLSKHFGLNLELRGEALMTLVESVVALINEAQNSQRWTEDRNVQDQMHEGLILAFSSEIESRRELTRFRIKEAFQDQMRNEVGEKSIRNYLMEHPHLLEEWVGLNSLGEAVGFFRAHRDDLIAEYGRTSRENLPEHLLFATIHLYLMNRYRIHVTTGYRAGRESVDQFGEFPLEEIDVAIELLSRAEEVFKLISPPNRTRRVEVNLMGKVSRERFGRYMEVISGSKGDRGINIPVFDYGRVIPFERWINTFLHEFFHLWHPTSAYLERHERMPVFNMSRIPERRLHYFRLRHPELRIVPSDIFERREDKLLLNLFKAILEQEKYHTSRGLGAYFGEDKLREIFVDFSLDVLKKGEPFIKQYPLMFEFVQMVVGDSFLFPTSPLLPSDDTSQESLSLKSA